MSEARKALEQAVSKIAKAYGELLKVAEKHGDEIERQDYTKARFYLDQTITKLWDKIDVVRDIAKATAGEFSLDSVEVPPAKEIVWQAHPEPAAKIVEPLTDDVKRRMAQPIDPSLLDGRSLAKHLGGRLTKQAKADIARPQPSIKTDLDGDDIPGDDTSADLLDDVDFIDDK